MTFDYFAVPVLVGINMQKISLYLGPEVAFKFGARSSEDGSLNNDPFEPFDCGAVVGASYQFSSRLGVDLRYVHGFNPLLKFSWRDENNYFLGDIKDGYNRTFQLGVFYFFKDKKQD